MSLENYKAFPTSQEGIISAAGNFQKTCGRPEGNIVKSDRNLRMKWPLLFISYNPSDSK